MQGSVGLLGPVVAVQIQPGGDQHDQPASRQGGGAPPGGDSGPEVAVVELLARCTEPEPITGDHTGSAGAARSAPGSMDVSIANPRPSSPEMIATTGSAAGCGSPVSTVTAKVTVT